MLVLVIILCVVIVVAGAGLMSMRRRLAEQTRVTHEADQRATEAAAAASLDAAADLAPSEPDVAAPETIRSDVVVSSPVPETRSGNTAALWAMERARSERTWRYSVSLGPDSVSVFDAADDPLLAALQVEVDAAREEVGTVVHLDAVVPTGLDDEACLLILRVAQELLAPVIRLGEQATLHVHADGSDVVITMTALDDEEAPVDIAPFTFIGSDSIQPVAGGARVRNVVTSVRDVSDVADVADVADVPTAAGAPTAPDAPTEVAEADQ